MEKFENVKYLYELFSQGSFIVPIFLLALVIAAIITKNKIYIRLVFVPTIITLLVILNPFFIDKIVAFSSPQRMVRVWWLLPIVIVFSYIFVCLIYLKRNRIYRYIVFAIIFIGIVYFGSYMFSSNNFAKAENIYKVPNEVIEICETIEEDGNEGKLFPAIEYVEYYRQYDANITLVYGRVASATGVVYEHMMVDEYDLDWVTEVMNYHNAKYLALCKNRIIPDNIGDYGYEVLKETESHILYKYNV